MIKSICLLLLLIIIAGRLEAQCVLSGNTWQSQSIPVQTGTFTASYDATPLTLNNDGVMGLSFGPAAAYTDLAAIVRFNISGFIDVMNTSSYTSIQPFPYTPNTRYHVRMVVSLPAHTYSVFVTGPGQNEIQLAANYAFRSPQAAVTSLSYLSAISGVAPTGICNVAIGMTLSQAVALANTAWGPDSAVSVQFNAVQAWTPWMCVGQTDLAPVNSITLFGLLPDPYAGTPDSFWRGCGTTWEKAFQAAGIQP